MQGRRAGHTVVPWEKPVITVRATPEENEAAMRDDNLRRHVAAELWDPQMGSEAIEVSDQRTPSEARSGAMLYWRRTCSRSRCPRRADEPVRHGEFLGCARSRGGRRLVGAWRHPSW